MRFRKLRIAWSVFCGLACVLLIVLWVRSYGREGIHYFRGTFCRTQSSNGKFSFEYFRPEYSLDKSTNNVQPINGFAVERMPRWLSSRGLNLYCSSGLFRIELPYKFLLPFAAVVTVLPWTRQLRFRFSLRTLLITTTLIAVVLGLAIWGAK
jgi:hypothetical protein